MSIISIEQVCEIPTRSKRVHRLGRARDSRIRRYASFPVVLTFIVLTILFVFSRAKVADPDIWWHLHNAEYLLQHHDFPRYDTFSFTVSGQPWMNHEWLGELPYYFAWRILGLQGIASLTIILLSSIFLGLLYLSYRECGHYKAAALACACAIFLARASFGPRTILFGYLYLVLLSIVLQRFRQKGHAPIWIIPPLFCLWVNTHGSWSIGLIVFSIVIVAGLIQVQWGMVESRPWTGQERKSLVLAWIASVALLFVNPFGARLVFYPFDLAFRQKMNIEHIEEWMSVNFHDGRGKFVMAVMLIMLISSLVRPRRWSLAELVLVVFAFYSGLTYVRFLFLLAILLAPPAAKMLDFLPPYRPELETPMINIFAMLLIIAGVVHYWPREPRLRAAVEDQFPLQALSYMHTHALSGPTLNFYLWGGYINWKDHDVKVFVDGRADIFEYSGVLKDYLDLSSISNPGSLLDNYRIEYVLFPPDEPLTYLLQHNARWRTLYTDRLCVLLQRTRGDRGGAMSSEQ